MPTPQDLQPAGLLTLQADPPEPSLKGFRSDPRPFPGGYFPADCSFRLGTPKQVGVGVRLNEFKPPEVNAYLRASVDRGGSFVRGRGCFDHYRHMQQQARLLIPLTPVQSRLDYAEQVWQHARHEEARRDAQLQLMAYADRKRANRLLDTKTMLQKPELAKQVSRRLHASCSLPDLHAASCGIPHDAAMKLLNRRVDVNRLRRCRSDFAQQKKALSLTTSLKKSAEMLDVTMDISNFERTHKALLPQEKEFEPQQEPEPPVVPMISSGVDWRNCTHNSSEAWYQGP